MNYLAKELNEYLQNTTVKATGKLQGSNNDKSNVEKLIKPMNTILELNLLRNTFRKKTTSM